MADSQANIQVNINGLDQAKTQIDGATASTEKFSGELTRGGIRSIGLFTRGLTEAAAGATLLFGSSEEDAKKMQKSLNESLGIVFAFTGALHAAHSAQDAWNTVKGLFVIKTAAETAAIEGETVAQEGLNGAMEANPIGIVIAGAAALVIAIGFLTRQTDDQTRAENERNEITKKTIELEVKNEATVNLAMATLRDYKTNINDRKQALSDLDKVMGTNLSTNTNLNEATKKALVLGELELTLIKKRAEADALKELYTEALKKKLEAQNSSLKDNLHWYQELWEGVKNGGDMAGMVIGDVTDAQNNQKKSIKEAGKEVDDYGNMYEDAFKKANAAQAELENKIKNLGAAKADDADTTEKQKTAYEKLTDEINKYTTALSTASEGDKVILTEELQKLQEKKDLIDEIANAKKPGWKPVPIAPRATQTPEEIKAEAKNQEDILKGMNQQVASDAKTTGDQMVADYQARIKRQEELDKEWADKKKQLKQEAFQLAQQTEEAIFQLKDQKIQQNLDDQEHALSVAQTKELANANLTQAQIDAINKKYAAADLALRQKAAKDKQKTDEGQALASAALAVVKMIEGNAELGPYAAIADVIEGALIAAETAVQINTIKSQPIPSYASGGLIQGAGGATTDSNIIRASKGEFIVNAAATQANHSAISSLNNDGGASLAKMIAMEIANNPPIVTVPVDSITKVQKRTNKRQNQSKL